ncbi:MAG TPA: hypothetical protein VJ964_07745 [Balneolaceae bacterium]|nr:hypothetical protein [Balneolaceae bacterium]
MQNIEEEISANQKQVENALRPAFISDNAWETAVATQAVLYMDFKITADLSTIHELQQQYLSLEHASFQTLYIGSTHPEKTQLYILLDTRSYEKALLKKYKMITNQLKEAKQ